MIRNNKKRAKNKKKDLTKSMFTNIIVAVSN